MSFYGLLVNTCTIQVLTAAKDSVLGETTYTFAATTGVPCNVQSISESRQGIPAEAGMAEFEVYFPFDVSPRPVISDRLVTIDNFPNATLEIDSPPMDDAGHGEYIRYRCRYVTGGGA